MSRFGFGVKGWQWLWRKVMEVVNLVGKMWSGRFGVGGCGFGIGGGGVGCRQGLQWMDCDKQKVGLGVSVVDSQGLGQGWVGGWVRLVDVEVIRERFNKEEGEERGRQWVGEVERGKREFVGEGGGGEREFVGQGEEECRERDEC